MGERMLDWDTVTGDHLMSAGWAGECLIGLRWRCWMAGRQLNERTLTMQDGRESAGLRYGGVAGRVGDSWVSAG